MRLLIYDATESTFVGSTWKLGSNVFRRSFDKIVAAKDHRDFFDAITGPVFWNHVQYWGHGGPGKPYLAGKSIPPSVAFQNVGEMWWRCCDVMQGAMGYKYAMQFSRRGVAVAGHTRIIHAMQSGLVGLKPDAEPWWDAFDRGMSAPWEKRTVFALRMSIPDWTWS